MDSLLIASSWGPWWLEPANWLAMFKVAAGLGFVIFVHELGHFLVAKACGVKCEKFYIGFDFFEVKIGKFVIIPRALFKYKYGETEYGIGIIPLGGYVKMLGQDDNPANREQENERSAVKKEGDQTIEHDPRSYLAKSVPQRMAIISAGVIMNLIFAVIFASVAFLFGVPYMPCVIGDTVPGGAAWRAGVRPGSKVIQLNGAGKPSEHLRWDWDLRNATGMAGLKGEVELLLRNAEGTEETITLKPRGIPAGKHMIPTLGVRGKIVNVLDDADPVATHSPASRAKEPFIGKDQIVGIRAASQTKETVVDKLNADAIEEILAQHAGEPVIFQVERTDKKAKDATPHKVEVEVAANVWRTLGLHMRRGPITGIRPGSPAEKSGLKEGDVIQKFAGAPFGDPMTFPDRLVKHHGQEITLDIERPDESGKLQPLALKVTPEVPKRFESSYMEDADFSVEALGIVYPIFQIVYKVDPNGPAAKSGLKRDDLITQIQLVPKPSQMQEEIERLKFAIKKPLMLNPEHANWPFIDSIVQRVMPETQIKFFYRRGDDKDEKAELHEALLTPTDSERFNPDRGLNLVNVTDTRTASSLPEAFGLGLRQTKEDALKIVMVLRKLVSGEVSPLNLSGGGMIFVIATNEAAQSTSRLLIFLTFLSANLAVVNFLPIPVLDGGHMMFLTWEGIFRRPLPEKWQFVLTLGGLAFVLCLFLFTTSLDVFRLLIDPFLQ